MTTRLLDEDYAEHERIPHRMDVEITTMNGRAITTINGQRCGSPLSDNRWIDDGYRFHDVFHVAHAAVLGWSPTLRALLGRKQKSAPRVDEIEDGGRAIVIEEGLTALVFSYAERFRFFENHRYLDTPGERTLIRTVRLMTDHLEVSCRSEADWENAILQGYAAWRTIRANEGGHITADLVERTVTVRDERLNRLHTP